MPPCPAPSPPTAQTKLLGETYVQQFCHRHFIVRTAWLYSYYGKNFVKTIVNLAKIRQAGGCQRPVRQPHQRGGSGLPYPAAVPSPTSTACTTAPARASAPGMISRPRSSACPAWTPPWPLHQRGVQGEAPQSADRPKWSALDNRMLRCTVGNDVRDWKDALACFFTHWDGDNGMKFRTFSIIGMVRFCQQPTLGELASKVKEQGLIRTL